MGGVGFDLQIEGETYRTCGDLHNFGSNFKCLETGAEGMKD